MRAAEIVPSEDGGGWWGGELGRLGPAGSAGWTESAPSLGWVSQKEAQSASRDQFQGFKRVKKGGNGSLHGLNSRIISDLCCLTGFTFCCLLAIVKYLLLFFVEMQCLVAFVLTMA